METQVPKKFDKITSVGSDTMFIDDPVDGGSARIQARRFRGRGAGLLRQPDRSDSVDIAEVPYFSNSMLEKVLICWTAV